MMLMISILNLHNSTYARRTQNIIRAQTLKYLLEACVFALFAALSEFLAYVTFFFCCNILTTKAVNVDE